MKKGMKNKIFPFLSRCLSRSNIFLFYFSWYWKNFLLWKVTVNCSLRTRIYAGMELEFLSAGTVAKFIIKSSCLFLLVIRAFSAETTDEIYSIAPCSHFSHACINANVVCLYHFCPASE